MAPALVTARVQIRLTTSLPIDTTATVLLVRGTWAISGLGKRHLYGTVIKATLIGTGTVAAAS